MKKKLAFSLALFIFVFTVSGCQTTPKPQSEDSSSTGLIPEPFPPNKQPVPADKSSTTNPENNKPVIYKIKRGDTLAKIAGKIYGDSNKWRIIRDANPDINPKNLKPGDEIKIPQNDAAVVKPKPTLPLQPAPCEKYDCYEHTIEPGESLMSVSNLYYGTHQKWRIIAKANHIGKKTDLTIGQKIKIPKTDKFRKPEKREPTVILPANYKYEEYNIRKGDNLGLLANKFYKDSTKWPYIAKANRIDRKTVLNVGQTIKIPVIKENPELAPKPNPEITEENITAPKDDGIKFYNNKQYKEAISELKKAKHNNPDDQEIDRYLSLSHFQLGEELFSQNKYLAAKTEYERALKYDSQCSECNHAIEKCIAQYCDEHYTKGKAYFKTRQPDKAYEEWKLAADANPDYKDVKKLIQLVEKFKKK